MLANVLEMLPLDVFSSLTDRYHPASTSRFLTKGSPVGISMNLGNVPASFGSSYVSLCKRGRQG